jgi:hypothetical protein
MSPSTTPNTAQFWTLQPGWVWLMSDDAGTILLPCRSTAVGVDVGVEIVHSIVKQY